jgi:DNA-binding NarL/FixJ family response regulator
MATQILLADGHEEIRKLIREVIGQRPDWHVCAEASDGLEAVEKAKSFCPDLALLAIGLPELGGVHAAQKILDACPQTIVIADSLLDPLPLLAEIKKARIRAFVSKTRIGTELVPAIEAVLAGKTWVNLEDSNCCLSLEEAIQGARRMVCDRDPTFEGFSCSNCRWRISTEDAGNLQNIEQSFAGHTCTDYSRAKAAGI